MREDFLTLRGCAIEFDRCSFDHDPYLMIADPNCFVLNRNNVRLLVQHDEAEVFADEADGSLTLFQDRWGLYFEAKLPDTPRNWDLVNRVRNGGFREASVKFGPARVSMFERSTDGRQVERVQASDLIEISVCPVGRAAQPGTRVWQRVDHALDDDEAPFRTRWNRAFAAAQVAALRRSRAAAPQPSARAAAPRIPSAIAAPQTPERDPLEALRAFYGDRLPFAQGHVLGLPTRFDRMAVLGLPMQLDRVPVLARAMLRAGKAPLPPGAVRRTGR